LALDPFPATPACESPKAITLKQLIQTHDYVGVCVLLAISAFQDTSHKQFRDELIDDCCNGSIVAAAHDQASRHLAMCFFLKKEHGRALEIAEAIAARNPDQMGAQVLVAQILADNPGWEDDASRKIGDVRRSYKLDAGNEALLALCEEKIAKRKAGAL
jgi:hypothetical protein